MTVIGTVFEAPGLTVSEKKTDTMLLRTLNQVLPTSPLVVEAAGQRYIPTMQVVHLRDLSYRRKRRHHVRSNDGSDSRGHATIVSSASSTIWERPRSC